MKKVFMSFIITLLVLLSFSCASNEVEDVEQNTFLKATRQGVVINIPEEAVGKVTNGYIYRHVMDENGEMIEQMGIFPSCIKELKQTSITDYFVEKGKEYYYSATFWGRGEGEIKVPLTKVVAKGGAGEITLPDNIKGTFDKETNCINFTPKLEFTRNITNFIKNKDYMQPLMAIFYSCPYLAEIGEYNRLVPHIHDSKAVLLREGDVVVNKLFGHELIFSLLDFEINDTKNLTRYSVITSDIDVPKTIVIEDMRKKLTVEPVDQGFRITLPPVPEQYKNSNEVSGSFIIFENGDRNTKNISVRFNENKDNLTFIDYFVRPGSTYEYNYMITNNNREILLSTYPETVTYNGKYDFAKDFVPPTATYNEKTGELTYTSMPTFIGDTKEAIGDKVVDCWISYEVEEPDPNMYDGYSQIEVRTDRYTPIVQVKDSYHFDFIYNKPMNVIGYKTDVWDNNIEFYNVFDASLVSENNMPEIIIPE